MGCLNYFCYLKIAIMPNKLIHESSPYLLQHAHNPVDWYPWGQEAFDRAKAENKPVLVSIGYATCHWCHVMEKESFENEQIAAYMNEHFVCIKVDREEHPDVDHFYMDALLAMQQSGGWPLNMFVTPDKKPFYGGTYFPPAKLYHRPSWLEILEAVVLTWSKKHEDIQHQSGQLLQYLRQTNLYETQKSDLEIDLKQVIQYISRSYDGVNGGFATAPKFPNFNVLRLLLQVYKHTSDVSVLHMVELTMRKLTTAGIYDNVGGGLCRYATDAEWRIPHFEKMLYDNALLLATLAPIYAITKDKHWMYKAQQVIQFCNQTLLDVDGLYSSAMDADSEGEEGKYYVWHYDEILGLQSVHASLIEFYSITEDGNWEHGKNIIHQAVSDQFIIDKYGFIPKQWILMKQQFLMELWHKRSSRVAPIIDTKKILAQNALMVSSLIFCYKAMGIEDYLQQALVLIDTVLAKYIDPDVNQILHLYTQNTTKTIPAKLDDIAYLLQALLQIYSVCSSEKYFNYIDKIIRYANRYFLDENNLMYYYSDSRQQDILVRKVEQLDGAVLSSNAIMSECLWLWGQINADMQYLEQSEMMDQTTLPLALRYPNSYASWLHNALRRKMEWSATKKNTMVTSFEHAIFYEQYLDHKYLYTGTIVNNITVENTPDMPNIDNISFVTCNGGHCKTPVKSVFQIF